MHETGVSKVLDSRVLPPHSARGCASSSLQSLNYCGREKKGTACSRRLPTIVLLLVFFLSLLLVVVFFQYVTTRIAGPGVHTDINAPFYPGCTCQSNTCISGDSCLCLARYGPSYEKDGHLLSSQASGPGEVKYLKCTGYQRDRYDRVDVYPVTCLIWRGRSGTCLGLAWMQSGDIVSEAIDYIFHCALLP